MADRDPTVPQSDDAALQADLIRLLRVVGPLGRLNVADVVVPTISLGDLGAPRQPDPVFRIGDVFTAGVQSGAPAFTTHASTSVLAVGIYDVQLYISPHIAESHVWEVTWGTVVQTIWEWIVPAGGPGLQQTLALDFPQDHPLEIRNLTAFGVGVQSVAAIFARLRT